ARAVTGSAPGPAPAPAARVTAATRAARAAAVGGVAEGPAMADLTDRRLPEGVRATLLDNGVQVVTEAMPDVRSVSVGFWVRIGSRDEGACVEGASDLLEHLKHKGTQRRMALEIDVETDVGGS